jgi:hypothetical protein
MAITNGVNYNQTQGLKISTNNLNRVVVSTGGTTTFTGNTSGTTVVNVKGTSGDLLSVIDNNSDYLLLVVDNSGNIVFQVNNNYSIIGGTPNTNAFVISGTSIGIGTNTPNSSAVFDITSTTKGFLPPRMTTTQRTSITPTEGLMVYDTTIKKLYLYTTTWEQVTSSS